VNHHCKRLLQRFSPAITIAAMSLAVCATFPDLASAAEYKLKLTGDQEVPAVQSGGTGNATITINDDMTVSGHVQTTGIVATKAHIHEAAAGKNGPVIVELKNDGDTWSVPPGTKLTAAQFASYKAGELYVNVHTAANPKGDMRAQIKP